MPAAWILKPHGTRRDNGGWQKSNASRLGPICSFGKRSWTTKELIDYHRLSQTCFLCSDLFQIVARFKNSTVDSPPKNICESIEQLQGFLEFHDNLFTKSSLPCSKWRRQNTEYWQWTSWNPTESTLRSCNTYRHALTWRLLSIWFQSAFSCYSTTASASNFSFRWASLDVLALKKEGRLVL